MYLDTGTVQSFNNIFFSSKKKSMLLEVTKKAPKRTSLFGLILLLSSGRWTYWMCHAMLITIAIGHDPRSTSYVLTNYAHTYSLNTDIPIICLVSNPQSLKCSKRRERENEMNGGTRSLIYICCYKLWALFFTYKATTNKISTQQIRFILINLILMHVKRRQQRRQWQL